MNKRYNIFKKVLICVTTTTPTEAYLRGLVEGNSMREEDLIIEVEDE